ncbi:MAG: tRNA uridine-5-carboxymethylaminomethyl(34) synthesis GTPase MnmE [Acidobacteria bacterium]|nr:tRNA uridine-5-carboxymethylaminomethyl(34) synthesis GTPase MnmE [Acidobacteriota bacterium]
MTDTIVALATPLGRSGIGTVRLSGPDAARIAERFCDSPGFEPRRATLVKLSDPEIGEAIDEAVVTFYRGLNSFTGEDVVEISCHGSPVVLRQVIDGSLRLGARMADPGEFSLRALANGKMNLAEAEAIRDLIDAQTATAARQAVRQMRGEISQTLSPVKDELLDVIVVLESALEFVEDDLPDVQTAALSERLRRIADELDRFAATFKAGHLIREGLRVAIIGHPNVGKSSLFNALLGSERAIVTDIAGTTRDQLHERFTINDIPISLIDTAGLRETTDVVESIGVERSRATMADADLVILMLDASVQTSDEDRQLIESITGLNYIVALNKIDKVPSSDIDRMVAAENSSLAFLRDKIVPISAKTGEGLEDLKAAIIEPFSPGDVDSTGFLITDARHHDLLLRARDEVLGSQRLIEERASEEIILVGLHNALRYFGEITGETTTEDMLTRIFSTFCIGK